MRIANRILAVLFAFALLLSGVLVPIEIVRGALHKRHWLLPWEPLTTTLRHDSWASGPARSTFLALAVVGLVLLAAQLKPRRPRVLPLRPITPEVTAGTIRRSLQQTLRRAATEVDGITSATARLRRHKATITAVPRLRDTSGLQQAVTDRVTQRLAGLDLARPPKVRIRLAGRKA